MRLRIALAAVVVAFGALACGGGGDDEPTPTAPSTARPSSTAAAAVTPTGGTSPTPVQPTPELTPRPSGNGLIDAIVEAVIHGEPAELERLLHYYHVECTGSGPAAEVPCPGGTPVGTTVPVIGQGGCESRFLPEGDESVRSALSQFVGTPASRTLYAVAILPPFAGDERVPGSFLVVFQHSGGSGTASAASAVTVDMEGVTYLDFGCGQASTPESFTAGATQFLIPPE